MKPSNTYDDSFSYLGQPLSTLEGLFDRCVEEIFEAVDNALRLRPVMAGLLITPFLTNPAQSGDICENLIQKDRLVIWNRTAANIVMDFDTEAHSICYTFKSVVENMSVEPEHICYRLGDETTQPLHLKFKSGASYDLTDVYNPAMTLQYYNFYLKECYAKGLNI